MDTISRGEVTQPEILKEVIRDLVRPAGEAALRSTVDAHFGELA